MTSRSWVPTGLHARRVFTLTFAALMLVQLGWILAVPAFRGNDEVDHTLKAAAVARGQLLDSGPATDGRGGLVRVPGDEVAAATTMCEWYRYTGPDNCRPVERFPDGSVTIATAASRYNPLFYAVMGILARPFHDAGPLYAMRAATAVASALLLAWAVVITRRWATTVWPLVALGVAVTPMLLCSTSTAAPNGIGFAAGCLLWSAAMGIAERNGFSAWLALATGASTMLVTHTSNGLWLASVALVIALRHPLGEWRDLLRAQYRRARLAVLAVAGVATSAAAWILLARTNALDPQIPGQPGVTALRLVSLQIVWALQTIGAFPTRELPAPVPVYAIWLVPFAALLVAVVRHGTRRHRWMLGLLLTLWVAIPMTLTLISYRHLGAAWQGRYALPLAVGFPILAGVALDRRRVQPGRAVVGGLVALLGLAHVISIVAVAHRELRHHFPYTPAAHLLGGPLAVGLPALCGVLLVLWSVNRNRTPSPVPAARALAELEPAA